MADFEGILARHSQSPYPRGQTFFIFSWREVIHSGKFVSGVGFSELRQIWRNTKSNFWYKMLSWRKWRKAYITV